MWLPMKIRTLLPVMTCTCWPVAVSVTLWKPKTPEISTPGNSRVRFASIANSGPPPTLIEPKVPLTVTPSVPVLMISLTLAWRSPRVG